MSKFQKLFIGLAAQGARLGSALGTWLGSDGQGQPGLKGIIVQSFMDAKTLYSGKTRSFEVHKVKKKSKK